MKYINYDKISFFCLENHFPINTLCFHLKLNLIRNNFSRSLLDFITP